MRLGVFEVLAAGPRTAADVAGALGLHPDATARLLAALAALGVLRQAGPHFANSPQAAAALVSHSPWYVGGLADQHAELLWPLWQHLPVAVRAGRPVLREAFGGDRNPFDLVTRSPLETIKFLLGMEAGIKGMGEAIAAAHDFTRHRHLVDVGGGAGTVSGPIAQRFGHLRATVLELPAVVAVLPPFLQRFGCGGRLGAHPGDFFRADTFPPCDAALLCRVLHDWSDQKAAAILRNTWGALAPGGVVLVAECLLDTPDPAGRAFATLSDLMMLLMTDGGRERSAAEYAALLQAAGFVPVDMVPLGGPMALIRGQKP